VTNREFTRELAAAVHRPAIFPVPGAMLKLAVGEFAQVLLASQRVVPRVAEQTGYQFRFPELSGAFQAILHKAQRAKTRRSQHEQATAR
jgi:NAD dependent epimerase/dehydratase family enzyme